MAQGVAKNASCIFLSYCLRGSSEENHQATKSQRITKKFLYASSCLNAFVIRSKIFL